MLKRFLSTYIVLALLSTNQVYAANNANKKPIPLPIQTSLVIDAKTGKILYEKNSTTKIYPASLTKVMTLYLLCEAIESGKLSMNKKLYVSQHAAKMPPSKLGVKKGESITVREAIDALAIKSANDVAVAVAESIAGSEAKFVTLMNIRAKQLGMKDTHFKNASGWHNPAQKTTAKDMAKLFIAMKRDYLPYYKLSAKNSFVFRGKEVRGHNRVNETYKWAETGKTGYTIPAGYNLITAASKSNVSLIGVVTGGRSAASRDQQMVKLLDSHFDQIHGTRTLAKVADKSKAYNKKPIMVAANTKAKK